MNGSSTGLRNLLASAFVLVVRILTSVAFVLLMLWLVGRTLTDRVIWSQWLWWIPTPAILVVLLAAGLALQLKRNTHTKRALRTSRVTGGAFLLLLMYFLFVEHRFPPRTLETLRTVGISIMHWNVEPSIWAHMQPSVEQMIQFDPDITVLTNPSGMFEHEAAEAWVNDGRTVVGIWPFAIATRVPVRNIRRLVHVDEMYVSVIEFEPTEQFNRPIVMYLIDLPSDPRIGRMAMAQRVRRMLDDLNAPKPDMIVGDFNITRGSASLATLFPKTHHAFDEAGSGYGVSFHRWLPLWHIDHMLIGEHVNVQRYAISHPKVSRHCIQHAHISLKPLSFRQERDGR